MERRFSRAVGVAAVVGLVSLVIGIAPSQGGSNAEASASTVDLSHPADLPGGASPQAAFYDWTTGHSPIYRPGRTPLTFGVGHGYNGQGYITDLIRAQSGFVVLIDDEEVRLVRDDGRVSTLFRVSRGRLLRGAAIASDGRLVAITTSGIGSRHDSVVVLRISDRKVVARHAFTKPAVVASLTRRRVLLTPDLLDRERHAVTRVWNLRSRKFQVLDAYDTARPTSDFKATQLPGDLTTGQVALMRGDHEKVVDMARGLATAWRTRAYEYAVSWSPDGRYVLTATASRYDTRAVLADEGWHSFTIHRASDGKVLARLRGVLYTNSVVWENASTVVFAATDDCGSDDCGFATFLRCTIAGACERVAEPEGVGQAMERRLPPS